MTDQEVDFGPEDREGSISHAQHLDALSQFSREEVIESSEARVIELGTRALELLNSYIIDGERGEDLKSAMGESFTALRDSFRAWAEKLAPSLGSHPDPNASTFFSGAVHVGGTLEMALWVLTPEKFDRPAINKDPERAERLLNDSLETAFKMLSRPNDSDVKWWHSVPRDDSAE